MPNIYYLHKKIAHAELGEKVLLPFSAVTIQSLLLKTYQTSKYNLASDGKSIKRICSYFTAMLNFESDRAQF